MALTLPADWRLRLLDRIYQQFKGTLWAPNLADMLGAGANELQAAGVAMLSLWSIDTITDDDTSPAYGIGRGVQLDRIGRLVGQARAGADDEHFRYYLRARIAANRSRGTVDDLIRVFQAMLGATELPLYVPGGNASMIVQLLTPITDAVAEIARQFLGAAKLAGVRALLVSQAYPSPSMFYFARACYLGGAVSIGDTAIDVVDASAFPATGTVVLEAGTAVAETVVYTGRSDTQLYLSGGGTANAHDVGGAVTLVGSTGKGFPRATYVASGCSPGDPSFDVVSSTGFAADDVVVLDQGLATEETTTITSTAVGQLFVAPDLTQAHAVGATVAIVGSGGALARAHQA